MPPVQTRLPPSSTPASPSSAVKPKANVAAHASTSSSAPYARPPPPYMVALSGWPEPVYISHRSRPSSPKPSFPGEVSDGIDAGSEIKRISRRGSAAEVAEAKDGPKRKLSGSAEPVPAESIFSKQCMYNNPANGECPIADHPNHVGRYFTNLGQFRMTKKDSNGGDTSPFPTSSTRTPTHSPPPRSVPAVPAQPSNSAHYAGEPTSRYSTFRDPRMAPHAGVLSNRSVLRVAPSWSSSAPAAPAPLPNVGIKVAAGERGMGILVMRSTPDVYPPPRMVGLPGMAGFADMISGPQQKDGGDQRGVGVATEVYPRDPDSAFLWGSGAGIGRKQEDDEAMDIDRGQRGHW